MMAESVCTDRSIGVIKFFFFLNETRMTTTRVPKPDPNTIKFKRTLFIGTKRDLQMFAPVPFIKLQNDT